jgi:hypothetical protein
MVVESLTTEEYHNICGSYLSQAQMISIPTSTTVNLGAIITCSSDYLLEHPVEIAYAPNLDSDDVIGWHSFEGAKGLVVEDGWMRYFILFL